MVAAALIALLAGAGCGGLGDEDVLRPAPDPAGPPTWQGEVRALMATRCAICHQDPPRNGAPPGFTFLAYDRAEAGGNLDGAFEKRDRIRFRAVEQGSMPPTGPLGAAERALLGEWIDAGAPRGEERP